MNTEVALEDVSCRVLILKEMNHQLLSTVSFPDPPMYSFFTDPTDSESRLCVTLTSFTSRPGLPGVEGGKEARRQGKSEEEKDR